MQCEDEALFHKLDHFLQSKWRVWSKLVLPVPIAIGALGLALSVFGFVFRGDSLGAPLLLGTIIGTALLTIILSILASRSKVCLLRRHQHKEMSFWEEHKSQIIIALCSAVVGAGLKVIVDLIFKKPTP